MADILIKGMEIPKEGSITITIRYDGVINVIGDMGSNLGCLVDCKAIELAPHGRLIDATELEASDAILIGEDAWNMVHNAPTVVEASR